MTDKLRAAAQQALDALDSCNGFIDDAHIIEGQWHWIDGRQEAADALREALTEQPAAQEAKSENPTLPAAQEGGK